MGPQRQHMDAKAGERHELERVAGQSQMKKSPQAARRRRGRNPGFPSIGPALSYLLHGTVIVLLSPPANSPRRNLRNDFIRGILVMMTGKKILLASTAMLVLMAQSGYAQDMGAAGSLESRVKALEDTLSAQQDRAMSDRARLSTLEQAYNSAYWTFDNGRPVLSSGDGRFTMGIRIRMQTDFAG